MLDQPRAENTRPLKCTIVIPALNEAETLKTTLPKLEAVLSSAHECTGAEWCVLIVDDGSTDQTAFISTNYKNKTPHFRVQAISLLRNFGQQGALVAGLLEASKDADLVVTIDADGEQPFGLIPEMVGCWKAGAQIVHTQRHSTRRVSHPKRFASALYYRVISLLSGISIRPGMSDFKLWNGELLRELVPYLPTCGSVRVFAAWLAPDAKKITYEQTVVPGRRSRYTFGRMIHLSLGGIFPYSAWPLRMSLVFGFAMIMASMAEVTYALIGHSRGLTVPGWTSLVAICSFFGGSNALMLGLLSEYLVQLNFKSKFPVALVMRNRRAGLNINK